MLYDHKKYLKIIDLDDETADRPVLVHVQKTPEGRREERELLQAMVDAFKAGKKVTTDFYKNRPKAPIASYIDLTPQSYVAPRYAGFTTPTKLPHNPAKPERERNKVLSFSRKGRSK